MASDYKKIAEDHEKRYGWDAKPRRIYKRLYSDKTHFVYELIQNADDSGSEHLKLQLDSNALLVWNDGRQFEERDVRSICSLGSSDKDLTNIGTFGIGFKAVYNYTDFPEIYSDDERFRIRDFIKPEGIDEMTTGIAELVNEGKTVFCLPFKNSPHHKNDIEHLKDRLCNLSKERPLLFLRHLEKVEWKDEHNAQTGSYACHRHPYDKIQNVPENESVELVELTGSLNGNKELSETFLVFRKKIHPPKDVIDKLLEQAEDEEEQQGIQQSAEELQPIEVAFKLQDDRITAMDDNCVLFAYLPTEKETHLKFLIQARYQTTPARDNIPKPSENPWNRWLVQETAKFLPEILEQLKVAGLLEPAFFSVLPLKGEVENEFKPIAEALQKAMREKPLVPTENGRYAKAETVFYPHRESLPQLIESSWLYPGSSWLHTNIGRSGRAFDVMKETGVKEINVSHVLNWLEKQDLNWFENRCEKWLRSLYIYLNNQKSQLERINGLERIRKLPLVQLENGEHVCVSEQLVFFPPDTDEDLEDIKPFLNDLPILQSILLEGENLNDIKSFLDDLDVRALHPKDLIREWIIPQYFQSDQPSEKANLSHVYYLFKVWDKLSGYEQRNLRKEISETPILWAYNGVQPQTFDFVKPCDAYLPKSYTGNTDLEIYFSVSDGDVWFVDDIYLEGDPDTKTWLKFLKAIGSEETLRVIKKNVPVNHEECSSRGIQRWRTTSTGKEVIEDRYLCGLSVVLDKIRKHKSVDISRALWYLLVKILLSAEREQRDTFFQGIYSSRYRSNTSPTPQAFLADFYCQLKSIAWLPDEQGNLHTPFECFAPTDGNRRVLGESVAYLHPDFDISQDNEAARWLANKLEVNLNADTNSVLKYLEVLSGTEVSVEKVEPLYRFLAQRDARRSEEFKQKSLIFTSSPEPNWWKADEVFWKDESPVFGNHSGYLTDDYEETLKGFFIGLGVLEGAAPSHYVRVIQKIASVGQTEDTDVRERVKILYQRLWQALRESGSFLVNEEWWQEWEQMLKDRCWLGEKGDKWEFFCLCELVWKDDDYRSRLFMDHIPFWSFDGDLLEFAKQRLKVEGCCEASDVEFNCSGEQREDRILSEKVRNLRPYIHDFLHSQRLCQGGEVKKSAEILDRMSVYRTEKLEVEYTLREFRAPDPNPRQSFLDERNQTLWLGLAEDEKAYPDLIGDALQDYFRIDQLREFVKDLLPSVNLSKTALLSWKRRGFQADLCLLPPDSTSKEDEKNLSEPVDVKPLGEAGSAENSGMDDPQVETLTVHEDPETGNENDYSMENEFETPTSQSHPGGSRTRSRGGKGINRPSENRGTGHSSDRNDGTGIIHMEETNTSPQARKEIENIGMEYARRYEEEQGHTVEDVSTENLGFDLRSTTPNGEIRCIEVKARDMRALVVLTSNEWDTAEQLKDAYFLYVVLNARTQPELYIIQNPADKVAVDERYDVRYQVPLSEITEHGIPV